MAVDIAEELIGLERAFWDAMRDGDAETMASLTDDPTMIAGAQGVGQIAPAAFTSMMENATWKLESYRIDDAVVRALGDDTAIVAYTVHEQLTVDDEKVEFDAAETSTWVRRSGRWLCALHTESILGDPFGRDRK